MRNLRFLFWLFLLIPVLSFLLVPQSTAQEAGTDDLAKYEQARRLYDRGQYEEALQIFRELDGKDMGFWHNFRVDRAIRQLEARIKGITPRPAAEKAKEAPAEKRLEKEAAVAEAPRTEEPGPSAREVLEAEKERVRAEAQEEKLRARARAEELEGRYDEAVKLYKVGNYDEAEVAFEELKGENLGFWRNRRIRSYIAGVEKRKAKGEKAAARAAARMRVEEEEGVAAELVPKPVVRKLEGPAPEKSRALEILEREKRLAKIGSERTLFLARHHVNVGKNFYDKLDYEKARAEFQKALAMNPKSEEALLYLEKCNAMLDIRKARIPEFARREFEMNKARIERARIEMERLYQEGKRLLADGDFEKAIARFQAVREIVHWMPYKEDVSEYERGTGELIKQAREEEERRKEEMDRIRREEAAKALAGEIGLEKEYKQKKINRLMTQAVEFRRMRRFEKAIELYEEVLLLEPEHFRATVGKMDCQVLLLEKKRAEIEEEKRMETEKISLATDKEAVPQSGVVKMPDDWDMVRKRTIPKFGRDIDVPAWRPPMEEALGTKKVSIFFTETRLSQVLSFLGDLTDIDFVVELKEDLDPDITIRVNSMTLRNALNWIATLSGTRWGLRNEAVYFGMGTVEESILRFYPIRDLMYEPTDFGGSAFQIVGGGAEGGGFDLEVAEELGEGFDPEKLKEYIKSIDAASWEPDIDGLEKNKIEYHAGMLLIINTPEVHEKVEDLLGHFRATRGLQVSINAQFIELQDNFLEDLGIDFTGLSGRPVAGAGGGAAGILGPSGEDVDWRLRMDHRSDVGISQQQTTTGGLGLSVSILDDIQVKMILHAVQKQSKGNILVAPKITCFDGQRANVVVAEQLSYVSDYEVETGGEGAVAASPVIAQVLDGVSLDVRPIVSADRRFITIEVRPSLARLKRPFRSVDISLGYGIGGPIDLPEAALKTVETTIMIPDGGTILMGGLMDRTELEHNVGIPFLSKIPLLNNLFRKKGMGIEKRNLILLIRGKIISLQAPLEGSI